MKRNSRLKRAYYIARPLIPRRLQLLLRRRFVAHQREHYSGSWPILHSAARPPLSWEGWPEGKRFALVLTHDVEFARGRDRCRRLMQLEKDMGFRSSFNFVPERYEVSPALRNEIRENGFEVGVHGLYHDGKLYSTEAVFNERAERINHYLKAWQVTGFRSPAMHHNLDWLTRLNIEYDASTFDTDPFEPQSDGVNTIFPFWVESTGKEVGYVELPYTLAQDFTLFVMLQEQSIELWARKLDWIAEKGGMALVNSHPDYMRFGREKPGIEEYRVQRYIELLSYIRTRYEGDYWHVLPGEMARFWAENVESDKNSAEIGFSPK